MFEIIESLILLGININFEKEINSYKITLTKDKKIKYVILPLSHLNEFKMKRYIDIMKSEILE